jgi:hypothetical protein
VPFLFSLEPGSSGRLKQRGALLIIFYSAELSFPRVASERSSSAICNRCAGAVVGHPIGPTGQTRPSLPDLAAQTNPIGRLTVGHSGLSSVNEATNASSQAGATPHTHGIWCLNEHLPNVKLSSRGVAITSCRIIDSAESRCPWMVSSASG